MEIDSALCVAGAVCAVGFSAAGSAIGIGKAACAAIGAWKKCYAQNKQAPYILFSYVGAPLTQTLYGMILMFVILGLVGNCIPGAGVAAVILGIFAGVGIGASAAMQGQAAAGAADSQAETGKGLANNMAALLKATGGQGRSRCGSGCRKSRGILRITFWRWKTTAPALRRVS